MIQKQIQKAIKITGNVGYADIVWGTEFKVGFYRRAPLITPFCFPTWAFSQLLRYQNTHLAMLNSVFGALYLKKIPVLVFQKELIEVPRKD